MQELKNILKKIKPKKKSQIIEKKFTYWLLKKLRKELKSAKIVLAGSFAKGTFLEGDNDLDVFILFKREIEKQAMESIVRTAAENAFPNAFFQTAYAEHPYIRLFLKSRKIDIIPAYEISSEKHVELKTAVDRTQLHTKYVLEHMSEKQKDAVRLLKKFLKSNGLYGAEIKTQGFSGYLCELLILKYKTFLNTVKKIADWKERTFIDLENNLSQDIAYQKFRTPLVVIDPVDNKRNVSAAVTEEKYFSVISLARSFIQSKNKTKFFIKPNIPLPQLRKLVKNTNFYCLKFTAPNIVEDVLWGQVKRFYSLFSAFMKKQGFEILGYKIDKCEKDVYILIELLNASLLENKIIYGPPLVFKNDCKKFKEQYKKVFILDGRLATKTKTKLKTMKSILKKIKSLPLPSHCSSIKHAKLYEGFEIIKNCKEVLKNYLRNRSNIYTD